MTTETNILIILQSNLVNFENTVHCVCSNPPISIATFVINLLNLLDDLIFIY